jgi:hypothetical protein
MTTAIVKAGIDAAMQKAGLSEIQNEVLEVERVFLVWMNNQSKSSKWLAQETGTEPAFVRSLLRSGEFQKRYLEETAQFRQLAQEYTKGRVQEVMDATIDRMVEIVEEGEAKDAIGAARVLASMVKDEAPREVSETHIDARVLQIAAQGIHSIDDLKKINSAFIDGNISRVEEARAAKTK